MNTLSEITLHSNSTDGNGLLSMLAQVLVFGVVGAIIWWLGRMAHAAMGLPARVLQVWNGLFIVVGAILVINFLLGLTGHSFVRW